MYNNVSDEFKEMTKASSRTSTAKIIFTDDNMVINSKAVPPVNSSLQSVEITDKCYDEGRLIGTTMAKEVVITIINKDNLDLADREFTLYVGIKLSNGTFEYVPYGNFIVTEYEDMKHNSEFKIIAYDYMTKLNPKLEDISTFKPTFPITLKNFKKYLLNCYGLQCQEQALPNDNFNITSLPEFEGATGRGVLSKIAELQGSFAKINRDNKVEFYLDADTTIKEALATGDKNISLTNVAKGNALKYKVDGNTKQETTPSPDYPSEVECLDGYNLFDKNTIEEGKEIHSSNGRTSNNPSWYVTDYISVKGNINYILSGNKTTGGSNCFYDKDKNYISSITGVIKGNLLSPNNACYLRFNGLLTELNDIQLVEGTEQKPYIPHNNIAIKVNDTQTNIDLQGNELCKIGDIKDLLHIDSNGKTTIEKRFAKYVFTGDENWTVYGDNCYFTNIKDKKVGYFNSKCNRFTEKRAVWVNNEYGKYSGHPTINTIYFSSLGLNVNSVDEWKQWLKNNPTEMIYELETPQKIQLTHTPIPLDEGANNIELLANMNTNTSIKYISRIEKEKIDGMSMNSKLEMDKQYGPVNVVSLSMSNVEGENVTLKNDASILENGETTVRINDNPFVYTQALREQAIQELYDRLNGFSYVPTKFNYKARFYVDCGDEIQVENVKTHEFVNSIILNQHIMIPASRQSTLENLALTETQVKNKYISQTEQANSHTEISVDKQGKQIKGIVTQIGDRSDKTTSITAELDGLHTLVQDIEDLTQTVEGVKEISLNNCMEGGLYEFHVYGNNQGREILFPRTDLYPSTDLMPTRFEQTTFGNTTIFGAATLFGWNASIYDGRFEVIDKDGISKIYDLGIQKILRQNGDVCDEYILKDGKAKVIRRINDDGTVKVTPVEEDLGTFYIKLPTGNNRIKMFNNARIKATFVVKTQFSDVFATSVTMKSEFNQTAQEISSKVSKDNVKSEINQSAERVKIKANNIEFEGTVTANENFKILTDGSIEAKDGKFTGDIFLGTGKKVIGGLGLMTNLQFGSFDWKYVGLEYNSYPDGSIFYDVIDIPIFIPKNFTISEAYITLYHSPIKWSALSDTQWGASKNISAYMSGYIANQSFYKQIQLASEAFRTENILYSEIQNCFGSSGFTAERPNNNNHKIEVKQSIDIKNSFNSNTYNYLLQIRTRNSKPAVNPDFGNDSATGFYLGQRNCLEQTGNIKAVVNIIGYLKYQD